MKHSLLLLAGFGALAASAGQGLAGPPEVIVREDFESTAVGEIPAGFTRTGAIGVADDASRSGRHSLKIEPAKRGGRFISLPPDKVAALGGEHWGRLYFKVNTPAPLPVPLPGKSSAGIHSTLVAGRAVSPLMGDTIEVRLAGFSVNGSGEFKYLYNVQPFPAKQRKEFGAHATATHAFGGDWTLLEWHADHATQTYELLVDGREVPEVLVHNGTGKFEGAEIPEKFETFSIGFTNYQPASGDGFTVWIDDLAIGKTRLGPAL